MSNQQPIDDEDFGPSVSNGYKPGQKKTMDEYQTLDADDEALRRWKESLGVSSAAASGDDPHNVVVLQLILEVAGRPDVVLDLTQTAEELKKHSFTIKEGVEYRLKVLFKVQHSLVSGLKYRQVVKRMGVRVDKSEEMIGSYAAKPDIIEKKFAVEEAPSGMVARGHYEARSMFVDDDGTVHKEWNWSFDIKKDW
ncbi:immunoglobulin E-set [Gamsiella multidivaricata]|uniref:immunoglobulin E-set n=1 Tax=Gamsiella multidivaricata TaxID=101098 RepID=UPI002220B6A4|nr:immunoglobulin E-set [Gamsiella multidivaricata]KAI7817627.1 immunoglobulin E-set [Gamsiella multidivaricata]